MKLPKRRKGKAGPRPRARPLARVSCRRLSAEFFALKFETLQLGCHWTGRQARPAQSFSGRLRESALRRGADRLARLLTGQGSPHFFREVMTGEGRQARPESASRRRTTRWRYWEPWTRMAILRA